MSLDSTTTREVVINEASAETFSCCKRHSEKNHNHVINIKSADTMHLIYLIYVITLIISSNCIVSKIVLTSVANGLQFTTSTSTYFEAGADYYARYNNYNITDCILVPTEWREPCKLQPPSPLPGWYPNSDIILNYTCSVILVDIAAAAKQQCQTISQVLPKD